MDVAQSNDSGEAGASTDAWQRYSEMDGLRGLACLIVLIAHASAVRMPEQGWLITGTGHIGVWLFFVLSAFLLSIKLWSALPAAERLSRYGVDRVLRIFPPFIVAVLVYHYADMIGLGAWEASARH